jgi:hypothetical protein
MRRLTSKDLMPEELLDERPRISVTVSVWKRTPKGFVEALSCETSWRENPQEELMAFKKMVELVKPK